MASSSLSLRLRTATTGGRATASPKSHDIEALQDALSRVVEDPAVRGRAPAYQSLRDMRVCPSSIMRAMHWISGGPHLDAQTVEALFWQLDRMVSGGCFEDDERQVAYEDAVRLSLNLLAALPHARSAVTRRLKAVQSVLPYVVPSSVLRLPQFSRERGEFDAAGQAHTERDVRGRVLFSVDPLSRAIRPDVADATVALFARAGFDVDVPPGERDCGWVFDQLGNADQAIRQIEASLSQWDRTLVRARDDERPMDIERILTIGPAEADFIRRMPERVADPTALSPELLALLAKATDVTRWLAETDIGPSVRWCSLRIGILARGDGRERRIDGQPREAALAELLRNAGYSVRSLNSGATASGGSGLMPWLAPDLSRQLARTHLSRARTGALDVIAVDDIGCIAALGDIAPCPVVHVVELMDWAHGGVVPKGLEDMADRITDIPSPSQSAEPDDG